MRPFPTYVRLLAIASIPLAAHCGGGGAADTPNSGGRSAPSASSASRTSAPDDSGSAGPPASSNGGEADAGSSPAGPGSPGPSGPEAGIDGPQDASGETGPDASTGSGPVDSGASGGDGILAATPPMGWNNYNYYGDNFDATLLERTGDAFVAKGLRDAGYVYVNMDDSWDLTARDASGQLVPDPAKFPDGIKPVADYLHARGLKLGIYADRGLLTCGGATHGAQHWPGSYKHEAEDAALFASWGVDLVKVDNCNLAPGQQNTMEQDYTTWANAIRATGRPMLLSICAWHFYDWMPKVGQMYRTTLDIKGNWPSFLSHLDQNGGFTPRYADALYPAPGIGPTAGPGHWNDPDMLEVGNPGMTADEQRAQFSLWAIMASPLILGNDVIDMDAATQALLTNHEVLAVDQDPLGKQGGPISASTTLEVWAKPLSGPASYAVVLFNRTGGAADITVTWASLGLTGPATVRDLWAGSDLGTQATGYTAQVPSHGAVMLKVVGGG